MFRNIFYGACCASALLSGIAMVEDVMGMEKAPARFIISSSGDVMIREGRINVYFTSFGYGVHSSSDQTSYKKKVHDTIAEQARKNSIQIIDPADSSKVESLAEISQSPLSFLVLEGVRLKEEGSESNFEYLSKIKKYLQTVGLIISDQDPKLSTLFESAIKKRLSSFPEGTIYISSKGEIFCSKLHSDWGSDVWVDILAALMP